MSLLGMLARRARLGVAACLALLLVACGGGSEQIEPYEPTRMFAFGDEMSVLTKLPPQGRKYTVNALNSDGTGIDCAANTSTQPSWLWTQYLADVYLFVFEECNPLNLTVTAFSFAAPGAKVDDFPAQLAEARLRAGGAFSCNDLMSVLIGANDVLELYPLYAANPTQETANDIVAELRARGARLAQAINALTANNGPKVILSTIPLMNLTPFALQQALDHPTIDVLYWLNQFSSQFNSALRTTMINDGSRWGLVELDALLSAGVGDPLNYGLTNITTPTCSVDLPNCTNTSADLVAGASATSWLWASNLWIGWRAHQYLGGYATGRATNNPFGCST